MSLVSQNLVFMYWLLLFGSVNVKISFFFGFHWMFDALVEFLTSPYLYSFFLTYLLVGTRLLTDSGFIWGR
jgi:hypothetical protein